jgi:hypothetical protein
MPTATLPNVGQCENRQRMWNVFTKKKKRRNVMPCDCHGVVHEHEHPLPEYPEDVIMLPAQYRSLDGYGNGSGWWQYAWDMAVADEMMLAQYADVLDVEIIDNVTWMQAIEMVSGYDVDDLVD